VWEVGEQGRGKKWRREVGERATKEKEEGRGREKEGRRRFEKEKKREEGELVPMIKLVEKRMGRT